METKLLFVIGPPRSGSTLLMRMLSSHSAIYSRAEPHLLTPLAHLGYYDTVDAAPFDHLQAHSRRASSSPTCRAARPTTSTPAAPTPTSSTAGCSRPAARASRSSSTRRRRTRWCCPFLAKLYPQARYVVLTRHPAAIWSSYANSFFDGDYVAARKFNPILNRYVPAMARFLREKPVPLVRVGYETLVQRPEEEMRRVFAFLDLPFEPRTRSSTAGTSTTPRASATRSASSSIHGR